MATPIPQKHRPHRSPLAMTIALAITGTSPWSLAQTISNTPRPEMCVTDGIVYSILESCGVLHLGGEFSYVGRHTGSFVSINAATGQPNSSMVRVLGGGVNASAPDGAGGWYIGGDFTSIGCIPRNRLAHILADGSLDMLWNPGANGPVFAMAISGNTIYVGGGFSSVGGQSRNRAAAIDTASGAVHPWNPNPTGPVESPWVFALAAAGNVVYAGGAFTAIGGQNRNYLAALDATSGLATTWNPTIHGVGGGPAVNAIAVSGNIVYAGGSIFANGEPDRGFLVALDATTGVATSWDSNVDGAVQVIVISGNTLYIGGGFSHAGGNTIRRGVAALDATNPGPPLNWNPNPPNGSNINAIALSGNTIYLGGYFFAMGGQPRSYIAAVNDSSGAPTSWNPGANDVVTTIAVSGANVLAGGLFDSVGGVTRNNLAAIDPATGEPTAWNPGANDTVYTMLRSGNTIYLGGDFTSVAGQTRTRLASVDATTGAVSSWNPNAGGVNAQGVSALALSDNTMFVGGRFFSMGGQPRNHIAAVDATTGAVAPCNPNAGGGTPFTWIRALAVSGNTVYVGGDFFTIGGQNRNHIAALEAATGNATAWDPNANARIRALLLSGNTLYAGGDFGIIGGQARGGLAALDTLTGLATAWNPAANGGMAIALSNNRVYFAGSSPQVAGAFDATTGAAVSWNPGSADPGRTANSIAVSPNSVYVGGLFRSVGGESRHSFVGFKIINADWSGGAGLWNTNANWTPPVVPNNASCDQYNVRITSAASQVTLDVNATINTLSMESNASLLITQGDLAIASPEGITNTANIFVGPGHALIANTATNICGVSPVELAGVDASMSSTAAANSIRLAAPVTGFGIIDAAIQNESTIHANVPNETLKIEGPLPATSGGSLKATGGGTLRITRSLGGAGALVADGGMVDIAGGPGVVVDAGTLDVASGGTVQVSIYAQLNVASTIRIGCIGNLRGCTPPNFSAMATSNLQVGGNVELTDGQFSLDGTSQAGIAGNLHIGCGGLLRGCTPPNFAMSASPTMSVAGAIELIDNVIITVPSTATVNLAGNFDNQCSELSRTSFDWDAGPLTMDGATPQTFELAGEDFGPRNPAGFINNFAMGMVRVEPGRAVGFSNAFDNIAASACEVLYVDTLSLGAGSTITLAGCNVYYRTLIRESGATVILLNGSVLMSTSAGDTNGDSSVDLSDVGPMVSALLAGSCLPVPACLAQYDLNGDGSVNSADISLLIRLLSGW